MQIRLFINFFLMNADQDEKLTLINKVKLYLHFSILRNEMHLFSVYYESEKVLGRSTTQKTHVRITVLSALLKYQSLPAHGSMQ